MIRKGGIFMFQNTIGICGETKIITQNGHTKNVEDLVMGDQILACDGTINELIEPPIIQKVSETKLYGIEGLSINSNEKIIIDPFFSSGQFIYTGQSYASIWQTKGQYLNIHSSSIKKLTPGMNLKLFCGILGLETLGTLKHLRLHKQCFKITKILTSICSKPIYQLTLYGGSPSFWANNISMGVTCPILTANSVKSISKEQLYGNFSLISKALGAYTLEHILHIKE